MSLFEIRKIATYTEEIHHDFGPAPEQPARKGAVMAVVTNPYVKQYVEDLSPAMDELKALGEGALRGVPDGAQLRIGGDGRADDGAVAHGLLDRRGGRTTEFRSPACAGVGIDVEDGQLVTGRGEVAGEVPAHAAEADERDPHAGTPGLPRSSSVKPVARRACTRPVVAIARISTISFSRGPSGTPTSIAS